MDFEITIESSDDEPPNSLDAGLPGLFTHLRHVEEKELDEDLSNSPTLDPRVCVYRSHISGRGLFARCFIPKGTIVWDGEKAPQGCMKQCTTAQIASFSEDEKEFFLHFAFQIDEDLFEGPVSSQAALADAGNYLNHSCNATCWFNQSSCRQLVLRRDVYEGDEITYDYSLSDSHYFPDADTREEVLKCFCNDVNCRGKLRYDDWMKESVYETYKGHFSPYLQKKVNAYLLSIAEIKIEEKESMRASFFYNDTLSINTSTTTTTTKMTTTTTTITATAQTPLHGAVSFEEEATTLITECTLQTPSISPCGSLFSIASFTQSPLNPPTDASCFDIIDVFTNDAEEGINVEDEPFHHRNHLTSFNL